MPTTVIPTENSVAVTFDPTINSTQASVIPAATVKKAGVMTARQVQTLDQLAAGIGIAVRLDQIAPGVSGVDVTLKSSDSTIPGEQGASLTLSSAKGKGAASGNLIIRSADGDLGQDAATILLMSGKGGLPGGFGGNINQIADAGSDATGIGQGGDGGSIGSQAGPGGDGDTGGSGGTILLQGVNGGIGAVGASGDGSPVVLRGGPGGDRTTGTQAGSGGPVLLDAGVSGSGSGGSDGDVGIGTVQGNATIGRAGARVQSYAQTVVKTSNYNANYNELVRCNPSGGGFNVMLPPASGHIATTIVKNVTGSANVITILPTGGDTIDGLASGAIGSAKGVLQYISDGVSNWMSI